MSAARSFPHDSFEKGTRLLISISSVTTAALTAIVAVVMLIAPATPRSLTLVTSTADREIAPTASPVSDAIASASDETVSERAATISRSLGVGRASAGTATATATAQNVADPKRSAPAAAAALSLTAAPTPSVDDARSFALAQIGEAQFSCLDALWEHESNWDASAENPTSGAYGIAQALPGAKMASVGEDWMSNPITQVTWGLEYIEGRYGTACDAWSFWQRHYPHWY